MPSFVDIDNRDHLDAVLASYQHLANHGVDLAGYMASLVEHIRFVREAGAKIGAEPNLLLVHDQSKFSPEEFPHYARNFFSPQDDPNSWASAWLHHIHNNPHHWQHWIFSDGFSPKNSRVEDGILPMPERYVDEMIADWLGASRAYTGSWDMTDWLAKNMGRIIVHSDTASMLRYKMSTKLDLTDVVYAHRFARGV